MDQCKTDMLADLVEVELQQRRKPQPEELLALYREDRESNRTRTTRQGIWIAFAIYLFFSITDVLLIPDVAPYTIAARFTFGVIALAVFELLFRRNVKSDWLDRICAAAVVLGICELALPSNYD